MSTKMYICVLNEVPKFITPCLVGHAVMRHSLYPGKGDTYDFYLKWLETSFRKCVVSVNEKEFRKIQDLEDTHGLHVVESWENKTLEGKTSCLTVIVDEDNVPNVLKFAGLWQPV